MLMERGQSISRWRNKTETNKKQAPGGIFSNYCLVSNPRMIAVFVRTAGDCFSRLATGAVQELQNSLFIYLSSLFVLIGSKIIQYFINELLSNAVVSPADAYFPKPYFL